MSDQSIITDQSANSKDEKGTAEISSFIDRSEDEDHNGKLSLNEQSGVLSDGKFNQTLLLAY